VDGRPRNPIGRTGLKGRGILGKWGPNHAADPIVSRIIDGQLQFVAIQRHDTGLYASSNQKELICFRRMGNSW
jgi:ADP-ribose pyrophosphatase